MKLSADAEAAVLATVAAGVVRTAVFGTADEMVATAVKLKTAACTFPPRLRHLTCVLASELRLAAGEKLERERASATTLRLVIAKAEL